MLVFNQNIQRACVVQNHITSAHSVEWVPSYYHTVECRIHHETIQSVKNNKMGTREEAGLNHWEAHLGVSLALPSATSYTFSSLSYVFLNNGNTSAIYPIILL